MKRIGKRKSFFLLGSLVFAFMLASCAKDETYKKTLNDPELFQASMKRLTDVIVHDIFSPPVASRIYAYPSVAAYEAVRTAYGKK